MKKKIILLFVFLVPALLYSQFEQKVSINIASGIFKTFGKKLSAEGYCPMQMPNYKMGFSANGGLQFKISERLSLSAEFGIMLSEKWSHKQEYYDNNYLYWSITDTITGALLAEGEDYLDIYNYSFGIKPKYYLLQGKRWNPYFYAGVNINLTCAYFENNLWKAQKELNLLLPDDPGPYNDNLEKSFGIGFNPGLGVEYSQNDKIHFFLESGYYFIMLNKDSFKYPEREENFNAFVLHIGLRLNFIKSKDL